MLSRALTSANAFLNIHVHPVYALTSKETFPTESCLNNVVKASQHNFEI